jgi:hypothetical protein
LNGKTKPKKNNNRPRTEKQNPNPTINKNFSCFAVFPRSCPGFASKKNKKKKTYKIEITKTRG